MATADLPCRHLPNELLFVPEIPGGLVPEIRASCGAEARTVKPRRAEAAQFTPELVRLTMRISNPDHSLMYRGENQRVYYCAPVMCGGEKIGTLIAVNGDEDLTHVVSRYCRRPTANIVKPVSVAANAACGHSSSSTRATVATATS